MFINIRVNLYGEQNELNGGDLMSKETLIKQATQAILNGDEDAALEVAHRAIEEGINPLKIIDEGFAPGMTKVADLFAKEEISLPGVLTAGEAMNSAIKIMEPHIPRQERGTVVIKKQGIFFGKRILAAMQPLSQALTLMESTHYTWPSFLWDVTRRVQDTFDGKRKRHNKIGGHN